MALTEREDLPTWLRRQLARREWSQADFARRVGASTGRVSEWISGKIVPNPESCDRIADVLGVDVDYVLSLAGHRPKDVELDPDSPEARLLPLMHKVQWDATLIAAFEGQLRSIIDVQRRKP